MQPVRHVIMLLRESPGFGLKVQVSGYMNSLQGGHLSKTNISFSPKGVCFRESWQ